MPAPPALMLPFSVITIVPPAAEAVAWMPSLPLVIWLAPEPLNTMAPVVTFCATPTPLALTVAAPFRST